MIKHMCIKNFQSHADTVLDFDPGVNAIVGDSHVGKSAIRRVAHWIRCNRPLGDSYIKTGTKETYARMEFDNGAVERTKSKKKNQYVVDGNPEPHTAFGSCVPEEVTDLVNMSDVNVQTQHGPFFLVFDSPGTVASYLRSVTGLDELSEVADDISRRLRTARGALTTTGGELDVLQEQLDGLDEIPVDKLEACIEEYRQLSERNESLDRDISALSRMIDKMEELDSHPQVSERKANRLFGRMDSLVEDRDSLTEEESALSSTLSRLEDLDGETVEVREGLLKDVEEILATYAENTEDEIVLGQKIKRLVELCRDALQDGEELKDLRVDEEDLLKQLDDCPYCGSELTDESRDRLIREEK